jgi:hypothetical protein
MVIVKYHIPSKLATRILENLGRKFTIQAFHIPFRQQARQATPV